MTQIPYPSYTIQHKAMALLIENGNAPMPTALVAEALEQDSKSVDNALRTPLRHGHVERVRLTEGGVYHWRLVTDGDQPEAVKPADTKNQTQKKPTTKTEEKPMPESTKSEALRVQWYSKKGLSLHKGDAEIHLNADDQQILLDFIVHMRGGIPRAEVVECQ